MASNAFPVRHCRSLAIFRFAGSADSSTRLLKTAQKSSNFCLSPLNVGTFNGFRNRLRSSWIPWLSFSWYCWAGCWPWLSFMFTLIGLPVITVLRARVFITVCPASIALCTSFSILSASSKVSFSPDWSPTSTYVLPKHALSTTCSMRLRKCTIFRNYGSLRGIKALQDL